MLAVVLALGAALLYAVASVLQQSEAQKQPSNRAMRVSLLARLVTRPLWIVGTIADGGAYVCQFLALGHGSIVLVQPLQVCGLLFALPLGARMNGLRLSGRDWAAALMTTAALAVFLTVSQPGAGHQDVSSTAWIMLLGIGSSISVAFIVAGKRMNRRNRALCYGMSAGVAFGLSAALTKTSAHLLSLGLGTFLTSWQPYALLVIGAVSMVISQSAFQIGPLDSSLPTMTASEPVIGALIGVVAFGETIRVGLVSSSLEAVSLIVMVLGVFALANSNVVKGLHASHEVEHEPVLNRS